MLQHDGTSPSPTSYIQGIYGTEGSSLKYPSPPRISKGDHKWASEEEYKAITEKYTPEIIRVMDKMAQKVGGHGGSDTYKSWSLIDCLRGGFPVDIDVYDSVTWSCILPLSSWSVHHQSNSIQVPDFSPSNTNVTSRNIGLWSYDMP